MSDETPSTGPASSPAFQPNVDAPAAPSADEALDTVAEEINDTPVVDAGPAITTTTAADAQPEAPAEEPEAPAEETVPAPEA